jgi:hypothetical protein
MWELYYGGWIAPNIYYLGNTGCVRVDGLRIMGMSGIFKSGDYHKGELSLSVVANANILGHYEKMPLDRSTMRSIYHIRNYDIMKIKQVRSEPLLLSKHLVLIPAPGRITNNNPIPRLALFNILPRRYRSFTTDETIFRPRNKNKYIGFTTSP